MGRHVTESGEIGPDTDDQLPGYQQSLELERYGGYMSPFFLNRGLGALECQHPFLENFSMDFPNELAAAASPQPVPSPAELDKIFLAERLQQIISDGFKAWQIPSLHEGASDPFTHTTLNVDPQKWHPIFRKDRWYDLKSPIDPNDRSPGAAVWSIDNPDVFAELSVCIEMANKLFAEALNTKWMKGLLVDIEELILGTTLMRHGQPTGRPAICFGPRDDPNGPLPHGVRKDIYNFSLDFGKYIIWTFYDADDPDCFGFLDSKEDKYTTAFTGTVTDKDTGERFVAIRMNARILRALLLDLDGTHRPSVELKTVEKHIARFQFAITMVHELAHALRHATLIHDNTFEREEPFFRGEWVNELGFSIEKLLLGATLRYIPEGTERDLVPSSLPGLRQYGMSLHTFKEPSWIYAQGFNTINNDVHWPLNTPLVFDRYPLPTFFSLSLQMQDFWDGWVATKGRAALHPPRIFRTPCIEFGERTRVFSVRPDPDALRSVRGNKALYDQYKDILNHLQLRKKAWKHWRGISRSSGDYFGKAYEYWQRTPYALMEMRNCVDMFVDAARQHDEQTCTWVINQLGCGVRNFERHAAGAARNLPFVFSMLRDLMRACIPWHDPQVNMRMVNPAVVTPEVPNRWMPSRSAINGGTAWRFPDLHTYKNLRGKEWSTIDLRGSRFLVHSPYDARKEMIEDVMREGQYYWPDNPTPVGLLDAIRVLAHDMLDALDAMMIQNGDEMDENVDWLPFNFTWPEFQFGY